jgi:hypothetical protein
MKFKFYSLLFLFTALLFAACYNGKSALKHGQYDAAVTQAVNRLKSKPSDKKATAILREAYPQALKYHMSRIENYNLSNDNLRYENIIVEYEALNRLYDQVQLCPAAQQIVTPQRYTVELNQNKVKAAELHYALGLKFLDKKTKNDAKIAYNEFERASQLMQGNFKDCDAKMKEAMDWAITKVIVLPVEVHSTSLKMSNDYFQNKILQYLYEHRMSKFVQFYSESEAKKTNIRVDEILDLSFDNFVVGQLTVEKLQRELRNDSVKIGETKIYIAEKKRDTVISIYGTVKATLFVTRRTLQSNGVLDMKIIDKNTNAILQNEKMPGSFTWTNQYGYYQGDVKALKPEDIELTKGHEMQPPMPQDLFIAFTQPIFTQLMGKITQRYSNY